MRLKRWATPLRPGTARPFRNCTGKKPAELAEAGVLGHFSAKKAVRLSSPLSFLLMCQEDSASLFEKQQEKEQKELQALHKASKTVELVQEFFRFGCFRQRTRLNSWISQVQARSIRELQCFASGLGRDKAAVLAGLTVGSPQWAVEGQVTRMKLIKRMMFARTGFALLCQRIFNAL